MLRDITSATIVYSQPVFRPRAASAEQRLDHQRMPPHAPRCRRGPRPNRRYGGLAPAGLRDSNCGDTTRGLNFELEVSTHHVTPLSQKCCNTIYLLVLRCFPIGDTTDKNVRNICVIFVNPRPGRAFSITRSGRGWWMRPPPWCFET